jgi:uncharacterized protein (DUF58 family)
MRPTLRAVLLLAAGLVAAAAPALFDARFWRLWTAYVGLWGISCAIDVLFGARRRSLSVRTVCPGEILLGEPAAFDVYVATPSGNAPITLLPEVGALLADEGERTMVLRDGAGHASIPLVAKRRGVAKVGAVWLRWTGPLGLVERRVRHAVGAEIAVVQNVRAVRRTALRFFARDMRAGLKVERYIGDGTEFESLREYVPGLDHRAINWKATARHRTLLCTEFRAERDHQVVIAVDTGHLMREPLDGIPRLDHAVLAGLHLAYTCLRTGDRVGWFAFDARPHVFAPPDRGAHAFPHLQRLAAGLRYSHAETNFTLGLTDLSQRLRRRSLVVLVTEFVDTVTAELMLENLTRLARRHLVLFVTLADEHIGATAAAEPSDLDRLSRAVVAGDFERERDLVLRRLRRMGIHCLDAPPARITADLLNRYLELKRRELY